MQIFENIKGESYDCISCVGSESEVLDAGKDWLHPSVPCDLHRHVDQVLIFLEDL
jgi:hypothetical protein